MSAVPLTEAQRAVFERLILGETNRQIGVALGTAEKTVKQHITVIMRKFGCDNRCKVMAKHYRGEL